MSEPLPMLPRALGHGGVSPCVAHDCRLCCFDTRMPLLQTDIERLSAASGRTPETFSIIDEETGVPRLANSEGHCVFLGDHGCTVYDARPAGCRLYPLVLDPETAQGILDPDCPHTRGFRVRPRDRAALSALVDQLGLRPAGPR